MVSKNRENYLFTWSYLKDSESQKNFLLLIIVLTMVDLDHPVDFGTKRIFVAWKKIPWKKYDLHIITSMVWVWFWWNMCGESCTCRGTRSLYKCHHVLVYAQGYIKILGKQINKLEVSLELWFYHYDNTALCNLTHTWIWSCDVESTLYKIFPCFQFFRNVSSGYVYVPLPC